jgi:hypothetical protein
VLFLIVRANVFLIFLFYFFFLASSSPIAGSSQLKQIADVVIPSAELVLIDTGKHFHYNL